MPEQRERPRRTRQRRSGEVIAVPETPVNAEAADPAGALAFIDRARDVMTVRRVYGDAYEKDGVTVIPAAYVRGAGGGGGDALGNGGAGFGVLSGPAGAYVIKDGEVRWEPAFDLNRTILVGQLVGIVFILALRSMVKAIAKRR